MTTKQDTPQVEKVCACGQSYKDWQTHEEDCMGLQAYAKRKGIDLDMTEDQSFYFGLGKERGVWEEQERITKLVEEYFKDLIHIFDPQATKESLIKSIHILTNEDNT